MINGEVWMIYSREHNAWWAPHERGYTRDAQYAGFYTRKRAKQICEGAGLDSHGNVQEFMYLAPQAVEGIRNTCKEVVIEIDERIKAAPSNAKPVFNGIADLHAIVECT